jgi:hypothetical protein
MPLVNIKLESNDVKKLKMMTQEKTGRKAVKKAILYLMRDVRQRKILDVLNQISFDSRYDPWSLRKNDR